MSELVASVQYNDFKGTSAADERDLSGLHAFAEKHGINCREYFLYGVTFYIGENHGRGLPEPSVSFLVFDKVVAGNTFEEVKAYIRSHSHAVPLKRFRIKVSLEQFFDAFKRFDVCLLKAGLPADFTPEIIDEEDEE